MAGQPMMAIAGRDPDGFARAIMTTSAGELVINADVLAEILAKIIAAPATEAKQDTLIAKDFATQTTLAQLLAKIISAPSTEAMQISLEAKIDIIDAVLDILVAKDFATQTTLATLLTQSGYEAKADIALTVLRDAILGSSSKTLTDIVTILAGILAVKIDQTTDGTTNRVVAKISQETGENKVVAELSGSNLSEGYIIPMFDLLAWSGFTNQPAGDGVEIVSDNAGDVGKITIFGTTHGTGAFAYETVTLNGVTAVPTVKVDWGNIYGAFLGDIEGKNFTPAVGTITLREASADQAITTITAGKISKGLVAFDLTGKQIILNVHSGNVWKRCGGVASATTGFKMNLTGGNIKEEKIASMLYLISDTTGATAQIEVLA